MDLRQAVILCGGLGVRLRPLTDNLPKPMVRVNEKPFLEYLIEQLKANGIVRILLLTGYKKEAIEAYFGDGSAFGVSISYSRGDTEWETGKRLYQARHLIDDQFFLLYADNFVQYSLEKLRMFYQSRKALVSFVVFAKNEKNNIRLGENGLVLEYDKTRTAKGLTYVELGCMIINKSIFTLFDDSNFSFSDTLRKLADKRELYGYLIEDPYYSISNPKRLALAAEYLRQKRIIILDRDGVINEKAPRGEYICTWEDFKFMPGVIECLKMLSVNGYSFVIISNQAGIARKKLTMGDVEAINARMLGVLKQHGIHVHKTYVCPHHWEDDCACRKPKPGMLIQASKDFLIRLDTTYFLGDDERDVLAASNCNAKSILIGDSYDKQKLQEYSCIPEFHAQNIKEAAAYILKKEDSA